MATNVDTKKSVKKVVRRVWDKPVNDYKWLSIASLLGFFPIAILAILSANKTKKLNESGDYKEAFTQSKVTKDWIIISFVNGVFVYFGILSAIMIFSGSTEGELVPVPTVHF